MTRPILPAMALLAAALLAWPGSPDTQDVPAAKKDVWEAMKTVLAKLGKEPPKRAK